MKWKKLLLLFLVADLAVMPSASALAADIPVEPIEQPLLTREEPFQEEEQPSSAQEELLQEEEQSSPTKEEPAQPTEDIPAIEVSQPPEQEHTPTQTPSTIAGEETTPPEEPVPEEFVIENNALVKYNGTDAVAAIPEGVRTIKYHAFYQNNTIEEIIFPKSMSRIDADGIAECPNLSRVTALNRHMGLATGNKCVFGTTTIEVIGYYYSSHRSYCDRFDNLSFKVINPESSEDDFEVTDGVLVDYLGMAEEVEVPDGITAIGNQVFKDNDRLKKITLPESVDHLQWQTFSGCANLEQITVNCRGITIADKTFNDCISAEVRGYRFSALADYCQTKDNLTFTPIDTEVLGTVSQKEAEPEKLTDGIKKEDLYKVTVYDMVHTYAKDDFYNPDGRTVYIKEIGYHDKLLAKNGGIIRFRANAYLLGRGLEAVSPELVEAKADGKDIEITFHYWHKSYSDKYLKSENIRTGDTAYAPTNLYFDMDSFTKGKDSLDGIQVSYNGSKKYYNYMYDTEGNLESKTKTTRSSMNAVTDEGYAKLLIDTPLSGSKTLQSVPYQEFYKKVPIIDNSGQDYEDNYGSVNAYTVGYEYTGAGIQDSLTVTDGTGAKVGTVTVDYAGGIGYQTEPMPSVNYSISELADGWELEVEKGTSDTFLKADNELGAYMKIAVTAPAIPIEESMVSSPTDTGYDGEQHKYIPEVTYGGNTLEEGKDYTVSYDTEDFKSADTITVTIEGINNYTGTVEKEYKIIKRKVSVSKSENRGYSGTAETLEFEGNEAENLVNGHELRLTDAYIEGTDAGTYEEVNIYTWKVVDSSGKDVTANYDIEVTGKLVIGKRKVVVNKTENRGYQGTAETLELTGNEAENLASGHKLELKDATITGTDAGTYTTVNNSYIWKVTDRSGKDVTANYDIEVTGKLVIGKRIITVKGESEKYEYTGTQQTLNISGTKADNLADGHKLELTGAYIEGTEAGAYTAVNDSYTWKVTDSSGKDVTANYSIEVSGKLIISKRSIKVHEESEKEYAGKTVVFRLLGDNAENLVGGHRLILENATLSGEEVGIYTDISSYTWKVLDASGKDVSSNYNIEVTGRLEITAPKEPDVPQEPDIPEEPDTPEKPEEPDVPEKPDTPQEPDTPEKPDVPQKPDTPEEPETPKEPDNPQEPDNPCDKIPEEDEPDDNIPDDCKPDDKEPDNNAEEEEPDNNKPVLSEEETPAENDSVNNDKSGGQSQKIGGSQNGTTFSNADVPKTCDNGFMAEVISLLLSLMVMVICIYKKNR